MVRVENLRAKSLQAEVAYLNALRRLGELKRKEQQEHFALRKTERNFWSEAVRTNAHTISGRSQTLKQSANIPSQLERMRRAHNQLQQATDNHVGATHNLRTESRHLSASQKQLETLQKLVVKASRARANRIESRLSEEIADLAVAARRRSDGIHRSDIVPASLTSHTRPPLEKLAPDKEVLAQSPQHISAAATRSVDNLEINATSSNPLRVQVTQASVHTSDGSSTLSLSCMLGKTGTLRVALVREPSGALCVKLDPGIGGLVTSLLRERTNIHAKLQSMGLQVKSVEVASSEATSCSLSRQPRRRRAEDDEDIIT